MLDRAIEGDTYTTFIGADNREIGKAAGEFVAKILKGKGDVVEIKGLPGSPPARDRSEGFREAIAAFPDIHIVHDPVANWLREEAMAQMESALSAHEKIDLVYAHNDPMAMGAFLAAKAKGRDGQMLFVGIDALPGLDGGRQAVADGKLSATFIYPTGGKEAIDVAEKIFKGEKVPKKIVLPTADDHEGKRAAVPGEVGWESWAGHFGPRRPPPAALLCGASPAIAPASRKAVRAQAMLDVVAGRIVENPVVLIEGERITAVGPGLAIPPGSEVFDLGDVTILPGLIDCHTHLTTTYKYLLEGGPMQDAVTSYVRAKVTLDAGFTTVRDLWAKDFTDVALRDAINRGEVAGRACSSRRSRSARPAATTRTSRGSRRRSRSAASRASRTASTGCASSRATRSSTAPTSSRSWRPRAAARERTSRARRSSRSRR